MKEDTHGAALRGFAGRVDVFKREDDLSTPHLQIRVVDGHNQAWRVPVNVLSEDQSHVIFHRADPLQNHPLLEALPQVRAGFTLLPPALRSASSALDYFRAPLFDWATGMAVPSTGPGAEPIPAGGAPGMGSGGPTPVTHPIVYIERALVNPVRYDPGKEVVVLGNTTTASVDLTGQSIVDKNDNIEVLRGVFLPGGKLRSVVLSGSAAQLSNQGGAIIVKNPAGEQVQAVSYSQEDAGQEDRYVRFNT
jgi:hypothetical protein